MRYRIDQDQLWEFLARQARLVERLPIEAAEAAAGGYSDGLDDSEREAVWLAAQSIVITRRPGRCLKYAARG